jgi:uncharacterized protein YfaS (alpha-2-macroglobulin family)
VANRWDVGDTARLSVTVRDAAGQLVDPTTVTCRVRTPSGVVLAALVVRDGVGQYHADVALTEAGLWQWEWRTTGTVQLVEGDERYVYPSRVP